jgi:hypothetical protein
MTVEGPQLISPRIMTAGKKRNKANVVTFSNKHNRKWQEPNLQHKKIYWEAGKRWVKLRISTTVSGDPGRTFIEMKVHQSNSGSISRL